MEIKNKRVYGEKVDINKEKVKLFWNDRANKYTEKNPYKAVKCNDGNNNYADVLDEYEKQVIIPKLKIGKDSKVLDIGCGIGRLAEVIAPNSNYYLGTDFAQKLLDIANARIGNIGNCNFEVCDFSNLSENNNVKNSGTFNTVILAGVSMYINDYELITCFKKLLKLLDQKSIIYLSDPIGVKKRLTLNGFYSEGLDSEYNVIYRTVDEYMKVLNVLTENGFKLIENSSFLTEIKQYSDTERHYFILKRD